MAAGRSNHPVPAAKTSCGAFAESAEYVKDPIDRAKSLNSLIDLTATLHRESLGVLFTVINWASYFRRLGYSDLSVLGDFVIVNNPAYFTTMNNLLEQENVTQTWKRYLRYNLLSSTAPYLGKKYQSAYSDFFGKTLAGQVQPAERWTDVYSFVEAHIQDAIARSFAERAFSAEDKATATEAKVAYPYTWETYSEIKGVSSKKLTPRTAESLSLPLHTKASWKSARNPTLPAGTCHLPLLMRTMTPNVNGIVISAAMMTPPNYFPASYGRKEDLLGFNYGSMAAGTVGHEFTHGFDNDGRLYDGYGQLDDWWTAQDAANFNERADGLVNQFSSYEILGMHIDGSATTIGENIVDL
ncbi:hypothetical protein DFJ77DRAFT_512709 [Powellomyces hirtus]|nr:hypothetical protein DFJ77DRAFT_512709 [Powellomyces hirtus]